MLFQKITLLLLLCPLLAVVLIGYIVFHSRTDSTGLGTTYLILFLLAVAVMFAFDRLAVRFAPVGWVSIVEATGLLAAALLYIFSNQTTTLDLSANRAGYVVVIWARNPALSAAPERMSLLNKTISMPEGQNITLDYTDFQRLNVAPPTAWGNGYFSTGINLSDSRYVSAYFYAPETHSYSKEQITELIWQAVNRQPKQ